MSAIPNAGEYQIAAGGDIGEHAEDRWVVVEHTPCEGLIFPVDETDELDVSTLLALIAAHRCPSITEGA